MLHMTCTHRVRDYDVWYAVFREHAEAQADTSPAEVWFLAVESGP